MSTQSSRSSNILHNTAQRIPNVPATTQLVNTSDFRLTSHWYCSGFTAPDEKNCDGRSYSPSPWTSSFMAVDWNDSSLLGEKDVHHVWLPLTLHVQELQHVFFWRGIQSHSLRKKKKHKNQVNNLVIASVTYSPKRLSRLWSLQSGLHYVNSLEQVLFDCCILPSAWTAEASICDTVIV